MKIEIPGRPIHKMRHRSVRQSGKIVTFDPQSTAKENIALFLKCQSASSSLLEGKSFYVCMYFLFQAPKNKKRLLNEAHLLPHTCKPDLDNLLKFYLDAGNGVLWPDDRLITCLSARKYYSNVSKTIIQVVRVE